MHDDVDQWVRMLAGTLGGEAGTAAAALEDSCRALEAQIAVSDSGRNPQDRLTQLESMVSDLTARRLTLDEQCAALDKEVRSLLEQRQSAVLGSLELARRQDALSNALEMTERAGRFFDMEFLTMSEARVEKMRPLIEGRLTATRQQLGALVVAARQALEQHEPALADARRHESEQAQLAAEIEQLEQQLGKVHHVEPALFDTFRSFSRDQIETYHSEVVRARLSDVRLENARGLKGNVWSKVTQ